eukprot:COSAG01_NODE_841_length_13175_cov_26.426124_8_plen_104_part_00
MYSVFGFMPSMGLRRGPRQCGSAAAAGSRSLALPGNGPGCRRCRHGDRGEATAQQLRSQDTASASDMARMALSPGGGVLLAGGPPRLLPVGSRHGEPMRLRLP